MPKEFTPELKIHGITICFMFDCHRLNYPELKIKWHFNNIESNSPPRNSQAEARNQTGHNSYLPRRGRGPIFQRNPWCRARITPPQTSDKQNGFRTDPVGSSGRISSWFRLFTECCSQPRRMRVFLGPGFFFKVGESTTKRG